MALPSVRESFEFSTKCTWLCMQSYFYFHKKLSRGLGMRPAARVISMTPLLAYETKTEQVVFHLLIASFR